MERDEGRDAAARSAIPALARAEAFCAAYSLQLPIVMAPMAGACPPALAAAVARAGGLGSGGMTGDTPDGIERWVRTVRAASNGAFMLNLWVPDPQPHPDPEHVEAVRRFLDGWTGERRAEAASFSKPDFEAQCDAVIAAAPPVVSSIMGLFDADRVARFRDARIRWWATVTTVSEAEAAAAAGADAIIAQGMEAGGHRGAFDAAAGEAQLVGLASLVPAVADAVDVPVVAAGGIADGRGVAAALLLGASAVIVGTALLRSPEAAIPTAWADALGHARAESTTTTRAFSGRLGRSLRTAYVEAAAAPEAPRPAPFPVQLGLTASMRSAAAQANDLSRLSAWAGQSAALSRAEPAGDIVKRLWDEATAQLGVQL